MKKLFLFLAFLPAIGLASSVTVTNGGSGTITFNGGGMGSYTIGAIIPPPPVGPWAHYRTLTINSSNVSTQQLTYSNFPVLISTYDVTLSTTTGSGGNLMNSNGYDLVFTTVAPTGIAGGYFCNSYLNWDMETSMIVGVSTMNAWVGVPSVSSNTNTTLYMCYGNSAISSYVGVSTAVWASSHYQLVSHLPNGTTLYTTDFSSNSYSGAATAIVSTSGVIDGGANFQGSGKIDYGNTIGNLSVLTIESWVNPNSLSANESIITKGYDGTNTEWENQIADSSGHISCFTYNGTTHGVSSTSGSISLNTWSHVVCQYDGTTWRVYINGIQDATTSADIAPVSTIRNVQLGAVDTGSGSSVQYMNGSEDEVRVSNDVKTSGWIKTEYNNESSPHTFVTIGAQN